MHVEYNMPFDDEKRPQQWNGGWVCPWETRTWGGFLWLLCDIAHGSPFHSPSPALPYSLMSKSSSQTHHAGAGEGRKPPSPSKPYPWIGYRHYYCSPGELQASAHKVYSSLPPHQCIYTFWHLVVYMVRSKQGLSPK
ncbi:hypothetical protein H106_02400 [Trichophyton rubrum CBS 735.88]|nr:hypothetical protein H106_02400 [Trichophyton rubrum CBS 735.88]